MAPFKNISLREHKGVRGGELKELGKINIVCGSNNSGKTSVLECIATANRSYRGIEFTEEYIEPLHDAYLGGATWNSPRFRSLYIDALRTVFRSQPIWYECFGRHMYDEVLKLFQQSTGGGNGRKPALFEQTYLSFYGPKLSVALVPAKRRLDCTVGVNSSEEIKPDGQGILNWLFTATNSPDDSDEQTKLQEIHKAFRAICGDHEFDVFIGNQNTIHLRFRKAGGSWLKAEDSGLGFRDLLILLYFGIAAKEDVVLLEEPESHLHPEMQRRLIRLLRESSPKQFFISTHSNVFLSTEFSDRVFCCRLTDKVTIENATSRAALLTELGYSIAENLVSDLVILCEGPKDKPVLEELLAQRGLAEKYRIKIWPLGGDIMGQVDLSVFQVGNPIIALIDADPKSDRVRKVFTEQCNAKGISVHRLERYALENYFTLEAIRKAMSKDIPPAVLQLDPGRKVSDQLGFEVKNNGRAILRAMTRDDIRGTDLERFVDAIEVLLAKDGRK